MMKNAAVFAMVVTFGAGSLFAQAPPPPQAAKPRPPQTMSTFLQEQYATLKQNLMRSAEKMPAEHFGFRPTPEVRTYAELYAHTIETQYFYCNAVKSGPNPVAGKSLEKSVTDKAGVVQMVKDGFAYCDDLYANLTDEKAAAMISMGAAPNTRQVAAGTRLTMVVVHGNEHYGNLVTYMRMKGIVPPSSAQ
jgi:uncharacterized damage-inducible protein DinB